MLTCASSAMGSPASGRRFTPSPMTQAATSSCSRPRPRATRFGAVAEDARPPRPRLRLLTPVAGHDARDLVRQSRRLAQLLRDLPDLLGGIVRGEDVRLGGQVVGREALR